jgi:hypothetical protein
MSRGGIHIATKRCLKLSKMFLGLSRERNYRLIVNYKKRRIIVKEGDNFTSTILTNYSMQSYMQLSRKCIKTCHSQKIFEVSLTVLK